MRALRFLLFVLQLGLAIRVFRRMAATVSGTRITPAPARTADAGAVNVLVPVLNEIDRLEPCLEGLLAQGAAVAEIVVIDGGSSDGTPELVRHFAGRDPRVKLVTAGSAPSGVNGKAHNLRAGLRSLAPGPRWVLTIDADVRPSAGLVDALLMQAERAAVAALSAATGQRLAGAGDGALHPAMLTTLVYRFGIPGHATRDPHQVQANGQCMLLRRDALERIGGFDRVQTSVCEDVTLARELASAGIAVGFYEAPGLLEVEMYRGWRDAWMNWARSLPMRDRIVDRAALLGLVEVTLVQALPLPLAPHAWVRWGRHHPLMLLNGGLLLARVGVLAGTRRAYVRPPASYWLSPLFDLPVALRLWFMALRRRHTWRGRPLVRGGA